MFTRRRSRGPTIAIVVVLVLGALGAAAYFVGPKVAPEIFAISSAATGETETLETGTETGTETDTETATATTTPPATPTETAHTT